MEAETPVPEDKILRGEIFIATQDDPATTAPGVENPFDSLLALYIVIKDPGLGLLLKVLGKIEPHPVTGQLVTIFDELPQQPVSHLRVHLREGGRSPLISPPACGTYTTEALFTPWAYPTKVLRESSSFQIARGVGGGPCPPAGTRPFAPGFSPARSTTPLPPTRPSTCASPDFQRPLGHRQGSWRGNAVDGVAEALLGGRD